MRRARTRIAAALAVAGALGVAGSVDAAGGLERVKAAGVLRWGGDREGGQPFVFEDPERPGVIIGFEVEIAAALARALGVEPEFVQSDWSSLVPALERGTFDIVNNGLEVTPARRRRVLFTRPYHRFGELLVVRADDRSIDGLASVRGRRVGTLANTLAWDLLEGAGADRVAYEGNKEPFDDLLGGRIDAVLIDDIIVDRYGRRPGLRTVGQVARGEYAIAVRQGEDDLLRAVDDALGRIEASGELRAILMRWGLDRSPDRPAATALRAVRMSPGHVALFFKGAGFTLAISAGAMAIAIVLGLLLALARAPRPGVGARVVGSAAGAYVEVIRGTPVLLQLYVLYFGIADVLAMNALVAAILGLGLNYAAYESEIYRAGIEAVPRGEIEAGRALGMTPAMVFRRVILPQALRVALPGIANDFIALLKDTSLVSVITVVELTKRAQITAVDTGSWWLPGILCAAMYFAMSYPLGRLARRLERRLGGARA